MKVNYARLQSIDKQQISDTVPIGKMGTDGYKYRGTKKAPIIVIGDSNVGQGKSYAATIGDYIAMATSVETYSISKVGGGNIGPQMFRNKSSFLKNKKAVVWVFDGRELYGHFKDPEF